MLFGHSLQIGWLYGIKSKAAISFTFNLHCKTIAALFLLSYLRTWPHFLPNTFEHSVKIYLQYTMSDVTNSVLILGSYFILICSCLLIHVYGIAPLYICVTLCIGCAMSNGSHYYFLNNIFNPIQSKEIISTHSRGKDAILLIFMKMSFNERKYCITF